MRERYERQHGRNIVTDGGKGAGEKEGSEKTP